MDPLSGFYRNYLRDKVEAQSKFGLEGYSCIHFHFKQSSHPTVATIWYVASYGMTGDR